MRRVKFYSVYDLSSGINLKTAEEVFSKFKSEQIEYSINEVIEFYNIIKFIEAGMFLETWNDNYVQNAKKVANKFKIIIGRFVQNICDKNFINLYDEVERLYRADFWELVEKYKVFKNVSETVFEMLLKNRRIYFPNILSNKRVVEHYDKIIRECLLSNSNNAEFILNKFEINHFTQKGAIYLPYTFSNIDKETLILNYIRSSSPNLNYLRIIVNIHSSKNLIEISDRTRLEAKLRAEAIEKHIFNEDSGIKMGAIVNFSENQEKDYDLNFNGSEIECTYNLNWIQDNLDFNTLLNNFIYLFGYVDGQMRVTLVNKINELDVFERISIHSKKSYNVGTNYVLKDMVSNLQFMAYYQQLQLLDIRLEDVIEWFFKEYVMNEFNISDYRITMPSHKSSFLEKCRLVLPEIESVLKQYALFVEDGKINHELLYMSSGSLLFRDCKGLIEKKYVYAKQGELDNILYYLFSDQCMLSYVEKIEKEYNNFYDLILNENITISDYPEYIEFQDLKWLLDNNHISISDKGYIEFTNPIRIAIYKELYDNEVISYWGCPDVYRLEIDNLYVKGVLTFENTLLSKPEQDYFNYHLNKTTFNNSLDLRNKYSHGSQPNNVNDEGKHEKNYMIFLKLFILIIIKINDELCIANCGDVI